MSAPAVMNMISLFLERVIRKGKFETRDANAEPPAIREIIAGRAQQRRVPADVNRAMVLKILSIFIVYFPL